MTSNETTSEDMELIMTKRAHSFVTRTALMGCLLGLALGSAQAQETPAGNWLVEDIQGSGVLDRVQTTLDLADDGQFHGSGGCNNYRGQASLDGNAISFGPAMATRMACPEAVMNQETKFFQALEAVKSWEIDGHGKLRLQDGDGKVQIVLVAQPAKASITIEVPGASEVDTQTVAYKCGDGDMEVTYINAGPVSLATFTLDGEFIVASTVLSGSGAKYAGGKYIWWTKGDSGDLYDLMKGEDADAVACTAAP